MATRINFIDLYSCYNETDASVVETLFEDYSITCSIRVLAETPVSEETSGYYEKRISVEEDNVENAKRIINAALKNGVISRQGKFRV